MFYVVHGRKIFSFERLSVQKFPSFSDHYQDEGNYEYKRRSKATFFRDEKICYTTLRKICQIWVIFDIITINSLAFWPPSRLKNEKELIFLDFLLANIHKTCLSLMEKLFLGLKEFLKCPIVFPVRQFFNHWLLLKVSFDDLKWLWQLKVN